MQYNADENRAFLLQKKIGRYWSILCRINTTFSEKAKLALTAVEVLLFSVFKLLFRKQFFPHDSEMSASAKGLQPLDPRLISLSQRNLNP